MGKKDETPEERAARKARGATRLRRAETREERSKANPAARCDRSPTRLRALASIRETADATEVMVRGD